jgi:hypothetical protein
MSGPSVLDRDEMARTAASIARVQDRDGAVPWARGQHTDAWNHVEAAMALLVGDQPAAAARAYDWCLATQRADGSWPRTVRDGVVDDASGETNMSAYLAVGVWHHWLVRRDLSFVRRCWPTVRRGLDFVVSLQQAFGGVAWSRAADGRVEADALLAGSSSIYQSLRAGVALSDLVGDAQPEWELATGRLGHALREHRDLFLDKSTYSMDWYYPVLGGAVGGGGGPPRRAPPAARDEGPAPLRDYCSRSASIRAWSRSRSALAFSTPRCAPSRLRAIFAGSTALRERWIACTSTLWTDFIACWTCASITNGSKPTCRSCSRCASRLRMLSATLTRAWATSRWIFSIWTLFGTDATERMIRSRSMCTLASSVRAFATAARTRAFSAGVRSSQRFRWPSMVMKSPSMLRLSSNRICDDGLVTGAGAAAASTATGAGAATGATGARGRTGAAA